ncbi:hypothetical protein N7534_007816 [Penicillium rubens]|nr:hypothetical protein N7534_007816 [Penicillium rubens]
MDRPDRRLLMAISPTISLTAVMADEWHGQLDACVSNCCQRQRCHPCEFSWEESRHHRRLRP